MGETLRTLRGTSRLDEATRCNRRGKGRGLEGPGGDGEREQDRPAQPPSGHRLEVSLREKRATGGDYVVVEGKHGARKDQEEMMSAGTEQDKGICSLWPEEGTLKLPFKF